MQKIPINTDNSYKNGTNNRIVGIEPLESDYEKYTQIWMNVSPACFNLVNW